MKYIVTFLKEHQMVRKIIIFCSTNSGWWCYDKGAPGRNVSNNFKKEHTPPDNGILFCLMVFYQQALLIDANLQHFLTKKPQ